MAALICSAVAPGAKALKILVRLGMPSGRPAPDQSAARAGARTPFQFWAQRGRPKPKRPAPRSAAARPTLGETGELLMGRLAQVPVKPGDNAGQAVLGVGRISEPVALVRVDDELGLDPKGPQGVPILVGLRGWAFLVAVADNDEGRGGRRLDEGDGRRTGVDRRIVIDRRPEK